MTRTGRGGDYLHPDAPESTCSARVPLPLRPIRTVSTKSAWSSLTAARRWSSATRSHQLDGQGLAGVTLDGLPGPPMADAAVRIGDPTCHRHPGMPSAGAGEAVAGSSWGDPPGDRTGPPRRGGPRGRRGRFGSRPQRSGIPSATDPPPGLARRLGRPQSGFEPRPGMNGIDHDDSIPRPPTGSHDRLIRAALGVGDRG